MSPGQHILYFFLFIIPYSAFLFQTASRKLYQKRNSQCMSQHPYGIDGMAGGGLITFTTALAFTTASFLFLIIVSRFKSWLYIQIHAS